MVCLLSWMWFIGIFFDLFGWGEFFVEFLGFGRFFYKNLKKYCFVCQVYFLFFWDLGMVVIIYIFKFKYLDKLFVYCYCCCYIVKSIIIYVGDCCEMLFFIIKGLVIIFIEDDDGCEMIIGYFNSGDFFGELGLFEKEGSEQECSVWVCVKVECEVVEISYVKFCELLQQDLEIFYIFGSQMVDCLCKIICKVGDLVFFDVIGCVVCILLDLCQ